MTQSKPNQVERGPFFSMLRQVVLVVVVVVVLMTVFAIADEVIEQGRFAAIAHVTSWHVATDRYVRVHGSYRG